MDKIPNQNQKLTETLDRLADLVNSVNEKYHGQQGFSEIVAILKLYEQQETRSSLSEFLQEKFADKYQDLLEDIIADLKQIKQNMDELETMGMNHLTAQWKPLVKAYFGIDLDKVQEI